MAAPPDMARVDYDYLIKLLLIGDSDCFLPLKRSYWKSLIYEHYQWMRFRTAAYGLLGAVL